MNKDGCCVLSNGMGIETFTGRAFSLTDPTPEMVEIEDIAHALSMCCRYAGHCARFYSVAEHSVHVYSHLESLGAARYILFAGIMHDAAEAYVGDVTRPLKSQLHHYRFIESCVQQVIHARFGVRTDPSINSTIKYADNSVLRAEAEQLMHSAGRLWNFEGVEAAEITVMCWHPNEAKARFLDIFNRYA